MKVKANYGISCEKGYFETGNVFEIDPKDLPMYGDAVTVVTKAPEVKAEQRGNGGDDPSRSPSGEGNGGDSGNGGDNPYRSSSSNDKSRPLVPSSSNDKSRPLVPRTRTTRKKKTE